MTDAVVVAVLVLVYAGLRYFKSCYADLPTLDHDDVDLY